MTGKKQAYALAGIPVYWIVNLLERKIEVCTEPSGAATAPDCVQRQDYGVGEAIPADAPMDA